MSITQMPLFSRDISPYV